MIDRRTFLPGLAAASMPGRLAVRSAERPLSVLFISVDDLRPELPCYGNATVKAPNIERLAARSLLFRRAYCQSGVCGPSRASLLTGLRPDSTKVWANRAHFRDALPNVVTLPQRFRQAGYHTEAIGKVLHGNQADPPSWSVPAWPPGGRQAGMQYVDEARFSEMRSAEPDRAWQGAEVPTLEWKKRGSWQSPDVPDNALQDGQVADRAIRALHRLQGAPFFLGVGFQKPHLPFTAPKRYFDLYDPDALDLPDSPQRPKGAPDLAFTTSRELRGYSDIPDDGPISREKARQLVHGYYAATSYMDAQVGRVVETVQRLGLGESTAIMLFGDHGWHLGEQGQWAKTTTLELDARAPLMLHVPGMATGGAATDGIVEFVDFFPTLCAACGVAAADGLEGTSMMPLLDDPQRPWKQAAFTQITRPYLADQDWEHMGYSIRTRRYRYTEWVDRQGSLTARELYDLDAAPLETENLAHHDGHQQRVAEMASRLRAGWRGALPPGTA